MLIQKLRMIYDEEIYSSGTITSSDNSGIVATKFVSGGNLIRPMCFILVGSNLTTDETLTVTCDWKTDSAGNGAVGTTTFNALSASTLTDFETWPGDVSAWAGNRDFVPMLPFWQVNWTVGGRTPSMSFTIQMSYYFWDA